ncbi:SOS-induced cell division inhibitor SulA [Atlantibacter sp.]|uniref:SOS-induced cell division inhibitor SulA n=1 Tax=Atlantibacter sp. TaxID=1903473 RepID=UPI0028A9DE66|nr:SOS-induced cell division inhibitor SulA [Atlantibacter sp.]
MNITAHSNRSVTPIRPAKPHPEFSTAPEMKGMVSEIVYQEDQPWMTQCVLLPLLQQLGQQSRWLLWLTPNQRLSRSWLQTSGLPLTKVMQANPTNSYTTVDAMLRALRTGNYSVVIGWLSYEMSDEEHQALSEAAEMGNALCFIMRPSRGGINGSRPRSALKIHSGLYH